MQVDSSARQGLSDPTLEGLPIALIQSDLSNYENESKSPFCLSMRVWGGGGLVFTIH